MAGVQSHVECSGSGNFPDFTLVRFSTETRTRSTKDVLRAAGEAGHIILADAWRAKLVPDRLSETEVVSKIPGPAKLTQVLSTLPKNIEYWLAYSAAGTTSAGNANKQINARAQALLRIQATKPPQRVFADPYPNITDLEFAFGTSPEEREPLAAALVYNGLGTILGKFGGIDRKAVALEIEGSGDTHFYQNIGFIPTGDKTAERVGSGMVSYLHHETLSVYATLRTMCTNYPWLLEKQLG